MSSRTDGGEIELGSVTGPPDQFIPKHETVACARCGHSKTEHATYASGAPSDCQHQYVRTGIKIGQWADTRETTFCSCPSFMEPPR